ncbi:unnamed protein product [Spirodela intermedia]|uniref:Uncharacterized protein n=2 Tax=Spirodela intermedia TaxID=51605 RepID=A0A7I8JY70_SPIIN|nr:unnamed protein product [Spirodela intermedia]CAA6654347.1 unnamed protein product [Spirodela intermedia]CAA7388890.1 unnamed protein product [Spirodela intermedia]
MYFTIPSPSEMPGQILLPAPKGRNLSGLNSEASSHTRGSLCIAHTLMNTLVPSGIL